jgi:excisionase family DNA binding protein
LERRALTIPEAAASIGVSRATLYRLMESGRLASVKLGGCRRITPEAIDAMLKEAA